MARWGASQSGRDMWFNRIISQPALKSVPMVGATVFQYRIDDFKNDFLLSMFPLYFSSPFVYYLLLELLGSQSGCDYAIVIVHITASFDELRTFKELLINRLINDLPNEYLSMCLDHIQ